jgi:hypothetical protein
MRNAEIDSYASGRARSYAGVGGTAFTVGLGLGFAGQASGAPLFFGGGILLLGSRVWEVVDLVNRTSEHNRRFDQAGAATTSRGQSVGFVPMMDSRSGGLALRYKF